MNSRSANVSLHRLTSSGTEAFETVEAVVDGRWDGDLISPVGGGHVVNAASPPKVVPAALVAQRLGLELKVIVLNYRDEANER